LDTPFINRKALVWSYCLHMEKAFGHILQVRLAPWQNELSLSLRVLVWFYWQCTACILDICHPIIKGSYQPIVMSKGWFIFYFNSLPWEVVFTYNVHLILQGTSGSEIFPIINTAFPLSKTINNWSLSLSLSVWTRACMCVIVASTLLKLCHLHKQYTAVT